MDSKEITLVYDGSFNGFLSAVFVSFQRNIQPCDIKRNRDVQAGLFTEITRVPTDEIHAKRVWYGLQKQNAEAIKTIYFAFLSEAGGIEMLLYDYIKQIMPHQTKSATNFSNEGLKKINQLATLVSREKRRIESTTELQSIYKDLSLAYIEPDFNVLPLLSRFFRSCYKNGDWILFDLKRKYGIYCSNNRIQMVSSSFVSQKLRQKHLCEGDEMLTPEEYNPIRDNLDRLIRSAETYSQTPTAA